MRVLAPRCRPRLRLALAFALAFAALGDAPALAAPARPQAGAATRQARLARRLVRLASNFEHQMASDPLRLAADLHVLERRAVDHVIQSANAPNSAAGELEDARALLGRVLRLQDETLDRAITRVRSAVPGEPLAELAGGDPSHDLYHPLDRVGSLSSLGNGTAARSTRRPAPELVAEQAADFVKRGGKASDIRRLSREFLSTVPSGALITFGMDARGTVRASLGPVKHPLVVAGWPGRPSAKQALARAAGVMRVYKDAAGEIVLVVISRGSGRYKAGPASLEPVARDLERLGVAAHKIVFSDGMPEEPQAVSLFAMSRPGATADSVAAEVDGVAARVARELRRAR